MTPCLRSVFQYAALEKWCFDFVPHDVGIYLSINGQIYGGGTNISHQMPIEECGNMLITVAGLSLAAGNLDFVSRYLPLLRQ